VLAPAYRRLLAVLEGAPDQEGLRAKDLAARVGLELMPAKVGGVRVRVKRLVARDWPAEQQPVLFTLRHPVG
jgi:hypothetical protein